MNSNNFLIDIYARTIPVFQNYILRTFKKVIFSETVGQNDLKFTNTLIDQRKLTWQNWGSF